MRCRVLMRFTALIALSISLFFPAQIQAAPRITVLTPRGLQVGATTVLTVEGTDLLPGAKLLLQVPSFQQVLRSGATGNRLQVEVTLPADVQPGIYHLRLANEHGVSEPVVIGIDDLPQIPFANQLSQLPAALHGNLPDATVLRTSFQGRKGQRLVIDLEARRLGSDIEPLIELYDARKVQVAYAQGQTRLSGDARVETVLPADGPYSIEFHDLLYRAGTPNQFRLKVGELHYVDLVYPLGWQRGRKGYFELIGQVLEPDARLQIGMDLGQYQGDPPVKLPRLKHFIGPVAPIFQSDLPQVLESPTEVKKPQEVSVPAVIHGRLLEHAEVDRYRLLVKPGMRLRLDLLANRAGSPLDAVLRLENDAGGFLAESDDQSESPDSSLEFSVPANVSSLVVSVRDLHGRGGPDFVYQLTVKPADSPDYSLRLLSTGMSLPRSGNALLRVDASRQSATGSIKLAMRDLPKGISISGNEIPENATSALVTLTASSDAMPGQILTELVGETHAGNYILRRAAQRPENNFTRRQPWLLSDLALVVTPPAPFNLKFDVSEKQLLLGKPANLRIEAIREKGTTGTIRLSLISTQIVPRTMDNKQEDRARAIRLEGTPAMAVGQSVIQIPLLVPSNSAPEMFDLAVRGDLLDAGGNVVASAVSASQRIRTIKPPAAPVKK